MDAALAELRAGTVLSISEVARKHNVGRSSLSRQFNAKTTNKDQGDESRRLLNKHQEQQLVSYIRRQCELCLPPTARIVANIAAEMAGREPSKNWSSRFVDRNRDQLDSRYLTTLDLSRHKDDSRESFKQYFNIVGHKIEEYGITADNIYNMVEKGFMIGQVQKTHRIFTKDTYTDEKEAKAGQDGNREWITVLATICADGTALSPALIYKAVSGDLQDTWLEDFKPEEHSCYFAATPNGWTSDKHGLDWLESVFHKETKSKARRSWRLLFVDGHGSHLNMQFIEQCQKHRILLAIYPPHSTHRLQPLDVSCFRPLAHYYSQGLDDLIWNSAGHTTIKKRDFFKIFWTAFEQTFTEKTIGSAWSKTGIWPFNPEEVLKTLPPENKTPPLFGRGQKRMSSSPLEGIASPSKAKKLRRRVADASSVKDQRTSNTVVQLNGILVRTSAELVITKLDNKQLKQSLTRERRQKTRQKKVLEQLRADDLTGTLFMSPSKVQKARDIAVSREQEKEQLQIDRQAQKQAAAQRKAEKEVEVQGKRDARAKAASERREAVALKKAATQKARAAKQAQKEREMATKALNRRSRAPPKKKLVTKRSKTIVVEPSPPKPVKSKKTRTGRTVKQPARLRT